jgi:hypothetical protein
MDRVVGCQDAVCSSLLSLFLTTNALPASALCLCWCIFIDRLIREWVTNAAINAITSMYNKKKELRKAQHIEYLHSLPYWPIYEQYRGRPPLHPHLIAQLQQQIAEATVDFKRGIDNDWKSCVVRYPDVLNHFYGQVNVQMPRQAEPLMSGGALMQQQQQQLPQHAPSVNPQVQAAHRAAQEAAQNIMRSSTAPPKKQRRQSKIGSDFNPDVFGALSGLLAEAKLRERGRDTPGPPQNAAPRAQRPAGKRRESREYVSVSGRQSVAPPHVPNPPSYHGGSTYDSRY